MASIQQFEPPAGPPPFLSAEQLSRLCRQGYLGLQLPAYLAKQYAALFHNASAFFSLSPQTKAAIYPSASGDTEQGYSLVPDEKEFVTLRYVPEGPDQASQSQALPPETISQTWADTARLLHRILGDISGYLSISPHAWDSLVQDCLAAPRAADEATPTLMRLFRYEPRGGAAEPHRDLGLLTLCVCRGSGLQVCEPGSGWQGAPEVTLLVGDTLRVLSRNRIPAGLHRVEPTEAGRNSIVFALRASTHRTIDLASFDGQGVIDTQLLWDAIRRHRVNVNVPKGLRDEMRARNNAASKSRNA